MVAMVEVAMAVACKRDTAIKTPMFTKEVATRWVKCKRILNSIEVELCLPPNTHSL